MWTQSISLFNSGLVCCICLHTIALVLFFLFNEFWFIYQRSLERFLNIIWNKKSIKMLIPINLFVWHSKWAWCTTAARPARDYDKQSDLIISGVPLPIFLDLIAIRQLCFAALLKLIVLICCWDGVKEPSRGTGYMVTKANNNQCPSYVCFICASEQMTRCSINLSFHHSAISIMSTCHCRMYWQCIYHRTMG